MLYILYTPANTVFKGVKHSGGLKKAGVKCESEITGSTILNVIIVIINAILFYIKIIIILKCTSEAQRSRVIFRIPVHVNVV